MIESGMHSIILIDRADSMTQTVKHFRRNYASRISTDDDSLMRKLSYKIRLVCIAKTTIEHHSSVHVEADAKTTVVHSPKTAIKDHLEMSTETILSPAKHGTGHGGGDKVHFEYDIVCIFCYKTLPMKILYRACRFRSRTGADVFNTTYDKSRLLFSEIATQGSKKIKGMTRTTGSYLHKLESCHSLRKNSESSSTSLRNTIAYEQ